MTIEQVQLFVEREIPAVHNLPDGMLQPLLYSVALIALLGVLIPMMLLSM